MKLSTFNVILALRVASNVFAKDGSSILKGAVSRGSSKRSTDEGALFLGLRGVCYGEGDCRGTKYCQLSDGDCRMADAPISGRCRRTHDFDCDYSKVDKVCGCDDKTYQNRCLARKAGVNVMYEGSCPEQCAIGEIPCRRGQYCKVWDGMCATAGVEGTCEDMPDLSACFHGKDQPVCGCDGETYICRSEAERAGVNVLHEGACETAIVNSGSPTARAIDIFGGANAGCAASTNIDVYDQNGQDWQQWKFNADGTIESVHCPGNVLNIEYGSCTNGANIILYRKEGVAWEQWFLESGMIVSKHCPSMVIEIDAPSGVDQGNGANVKLGAVSGGWNQMWKLQ
mmetsp:Transcript_14415/g.33132  ORF Transcript_14415/g.33132 Transcript_14415/m.33132 type:complete len:341 (+) Transcript_14415:340-1362(+)